MTTPEQRLAYLESLDAERTEALADAERLTAGMSQVAAFRAANAAALMGRHAIPAIRDLIALREQVEALLREYDAGNLWSSQTVDRLRALLDDNEKKEQ